MKILFFSNSPHCPTGYGNQTNLFVSRLAKAGHEMTVTAFYGVQGAPIKSDGITILPAGRHAYGLDVLVADAEFTQADIVITLMDVWVLPNELTQAIRWTPWLPVDHDPVPPGVVQALGTAFAPIAYSKFGKDRLEKAGLKPLYVPHGVDTTVFFPEDKQVARSRFNVAEDVFMVAMVAANKGVPSRKAFDQQIRAFARFHERHPDSLLYLHTDVSGRQGISIDHLIKMSGLPPGAIGVPPTYKYLRGMLGPDYMRDVYNAADVLLNATKGEGFGIPIIEAQACGTPAIVTDFTAMPELVPDDVGWKVKWDEDDKFYSQESYQVTPPVSGIVAALEEAYAARADKQRGERARAWIVDNYDADLVVEKHWKPVLSEIEERVKKAQGRDMPVVIEPVKKKRAKKKTRKKKRAKQYDVSVLMAAHNPVGSYPEGQFQKAMGTALAPRDINVQLCYVDDASSEEVLSPQEAAMCDFGARPVYHKENRGPAAAYQTAAKMATGRYIILQSVRSWYEPGAFKAMVDVLDNNPDVGFVYGQTQYHGARTDLYIPPPYRKQDFQHHLASLFGYMYRREALDAGCEYVSYLEREGKRIDVCDRDFAMQLIVKMGWKGWAMRDKLCLNYLYSGEGQMTNLVHKYQSDIDAIYQERWASCVSAG